MPIRLVHVVDEQTAEDAARLCSLLLRRLPSTEVTQSAIIMGHLPSGLELPEGVCASRIGRPLCFGRLLSTARLSHKIEELRADSVLAYSAMASAATCSDSMAVPVTAVLADPSDAADSSRWLRSGGIDTIKAVCLSGIVQRRLVEHGTPMSSTTVIQPGVDFAEIRRARERVNRTAMNLPVKGKILVVPSPASRSGGHYFGVWAAAILHHIWPDTVLILPGHSREQERMGRLVEAIGCQAAYWLSRDRYSPAELMAVADALIVPAIGDSPMGYVAWAMAAGVPIIGSAVPCVAEYIADGQNGFLCKPGEAHTLAIRVRTAFESPDALSTCVQAGRHQAYETFRAEKCVDEFLTVVRNMKACHPAPIS